jgi:hypothetical protein
VPEIVASTFVLAVQDLDASRTFFCLVEDLRVEGWSFLSRGAPITHGSRIFTSAISPDYTRKYESSM